MYHVGHDPTPEAYTKYVEMTSALGRLLFPEALTTVGEPGDAGSFLTVCGSLLMMILCDWRSRGGLRSMGTVHVRPELGKFSPGIVGGDDFWKWKWKWEKKKEINILEKNTPRFCQG